ncbi:MAG: zinc ribbon domain-containing protein [Desulfuromonadales bacterium]|jgi:putative FmdB family regulatory protein
MPLYEFHCPVCQKTFEKILVEPQDNLPCPTCGKPATRKVSAFAATASACTPTFGSGFG